MRPYRVHGEGIENTPGDIVILIEVASVTPKRDGGFFGESVTGRVVRPLFSKPGWFGGTIGG
jgi:hypothetical protein